jgi:hypothetical protein
MVLCPTIAFRDNYTVPISSRLCRLPSLHTMLCSYHSCFHNASCTARLGTQGHSSPAVLSLFSVRARRIPSLCGPGHGRPVGLNDCRGWWRGVQEYSKISARNRIRGEALLGWHLRRNAQGRSRGYGTAATQTRPYF